MPRPTPTRSGRVRIKGGRSGDDGEDASATNLPTPNGTHHNENPRPHNTTTGEAELSKRDSSVKKNAALTRRLRAVAEEGRAQLLADLSRANLSRVSQPAAAAHVVVVVVVVFACTEGT